MLADADDDDMSVYMYGESEQRNAGISGMAGRVTGPEGTVLAQDQLRLINVAWWKPGPAGL